jgi:hypothetical protein
MFAISAGGHEEYIKVSEGVETLAYLTIVRRDLLDAQPFQIISKCRVERRPRSASKRLSGRETRSTEASFPTQITTILPR